MANVQEFWKRVRETREKLAGEHGEFVWLIRLEPDPTGGERVVGEAVEVRIDGPNGAAYKLCRTGDDYAWRIASKAEITAARKSAERRKEDVVRMDQERRHGLSGGVEGAVARLIERLDQQQGKAGAGAAANKGE